MHRNNLQTLPSKYSRERENLKSAWRTVSGAHQLTSMAKLMSFMLREQTHSQNKQTKWSGIEGSSTPLALHGHLHTHVHIYAPIHRQVHKFQKNSIIYVSYDLEMKCQQNTNKVLDVLGSYRHSKKRREALRQLTGRVRGLYINKRARC